MANRRSRRNPGSCAMFAVILFVAAWMAAGWLLRLDPNLYLSRDPRACAMRWGTRSGMPSWRAGEVDQEPSRGKTVPGPSLMKLELDRAGMIRRGSKERSMSTRLSKLRLVVGRPVR